MSRILPLLLAGWLMLFCQISYAGSDQYAFVQMGKLNLKDNDSTIEDNGTTLSGEYDDLPFFTGGVQKVLGGEVFRYGYEGGALLSWQNDSVRYAAVSDGGTQIAVTVDNEMFMFGTFLGGYGDINIKDRVRFFVSGGPMLMVATLDQEGDDSNVIQPVSTVIVNGDERDISFGYGVYGSVGGIVSVTPEAEFGVVLREQNVELDFSDAIADFPYDGTQIMLSLGYRL
jgi:hypothetical protein